MKKVISFGSKLLTGDGRDVTHMVTSINVDSWNHMVTVVIEKGLTVDTVEITMEQAQDIGFINLNALEKYCK